MNEKGIRRGVEVRQILTCEISSITYVVPGQKHQVMCKTHTYTRRFMAGTASRPLFFCRPHGSWIGPACVVLAVSHIHLPIFDLGTIPSQRQRGEDDMIPGLYHLYLIFTGIAFVLGLIFLNLESVTQKSTDISGQSITRNIYYIATWALS